MKKFLLVLLFALSLPLVFSASSHAVGIGLYGSFGTGTQDWDSGDSAWSPDTKFSTDSEHKSAGFTLDTRLAGRRLFNYHLNLGYDTFTDKDFILVPSFGTTVTSDVEMKGFVMSHAFGFGGSIAPGVRLWFGPELRFEWAKGSPEQAPDVDIKMFGVGIGPTLGLNFNSPAGFTFMLKTGYQFISYAADVDGFMGASYVSKSYDIDESLVYVNLEFLFRSLGDRN